MMYLYCKTLLLLLRCDTGKVGSGVCGMGGFKGGLRCKGSTVHYKCNYINYCCNYMYSRYF